MAWRRALRAAGAAGLAGLLAAWFPSVASAQTVAFTLSDPRITEASGMARDEAADLYWTVNDSGDDGTVYGVGPNGKVRGTLRFRAQPRDVEAVATHDDRLYVADIGDNDAERDQVTVYYFDNPRASGLTVSYRAWDFRYPDGAHDAETLLVTPDDRLYVITKEAGAGLYRAPAEPSRQRINELTRVADAPAGVTDGVVLPGGKQLALLTYSQVLVVDAQTMAVQASAAVTDLKQAEALSLGLDGQSLLVGGEGRRSKVYAMPVPGASPSPTPGASTAPADSGSDDDPEAGQTAASPTEKGTWLAVGLAAVVAVVAGVVVATARRS